MGITLEGAAKPHAELKKEIHNAHVAGLHQISCGPFVLKRERRSLSAFSHSEP